MSIEVISNAANAFLISSSGAVNSRFPFRRWHESHSWGEATDAYRLSVACKWDLRCHKRILVCWNSFQGWVLCRTYLFLVRCSGLNLYSIQTVATCLLKASTWGNFGSGSMFDHEIEPSQHQGPTHKFRVPVREVFQIHESHVVGSNQETLTVEVTSEIFGVPHYSEHLGLGCRISLLSFI